jgi:hypothetical protein
MGEFVLGQLLVEEGQSLVEDVDAQRAWIILEN